MSAGYACTCAKRKLRVLHRNQRCSAFDGYRVKWSPYSEVLCLWCGRIWRSKAKFVGVTLDISEKELRWWREHHAQETWYSETWEAYNHAED